LQGGFVAKHFAIGPPSNVEAQPALSRQLVKDCWSRRTAEAFGDRAKTESLTFRMTLEATGV